MKVTRDLEVNAAYVAFAEIGPGDAVRQLPVDDEDGDTVAVLDFAADGKLLGIELLDAERQLPAAFRS